MKGYEGWAYSARTQDKEIFLAYFEKDCPRSLIRGARVMSLYGAKWFDPRQGTWSEVGDGALKANEIGEIQLPDFPSDMDWGNQFGIPGTGSHAEALLISHRVIL